MRFFIQSVSLYRKLNLRCFHSLLFYILNIDFIYLVSKMKIFCSPRNNFDGHTLVYALLRYAVEEEFKIPMPEIEKTQDGKPFFPSTPDIHFSLSHCKSHVLCAVSRFPVGADIEDTRDIKPSLDLRVRSEKERECFDFFRSWVLKESYIKLIGRLDRNLKDICFYTIGQNIIGPQPNIISKVYPLGGGCFAAVCSFVEFAPNDIIMISPEKLDISS